MIDKNTVQAIVEEYLVNSEMFLVDINVRPDDRIEVVIDSDEMISLANCADLSRYIESKLDRNTNNFGLEVGSASLTEPFKVHRQYWKNIGNEVEVLKTDGQKLIGHLTLVNTKNIILRLEKTVKPKGSDRKINVFEDVTVNYDEIKHTKNIIKFI
ncbi:MAG: ribosome assembly cofactor RimP [Candidatus Symbiothrix sp.]|jgi:ribosome maturation factor RimP|nr:ribosome assembly cofactor RimP [Candidatus Symbiothrix sp.]